MINNNQSDKDLVRLGFLSPFTHNFCLHQYYLAVLVHLTPFSFYFSFFFPVCSITRSSSTALALTFARSRNRGVGAWGWFVPDFQFVKRSEIWNSAIAAVEGKNERSLGRVGSDRVNQNSLAFSLSRY